MKLLDTFTVTSSSGDHTIELYHGDLTAIPSDQAVDVLVVSASPSHYRAVRGTLIDGLAQRGVSVADLAEDKLIDLREQFACWLSRDIPAIEPPLNAQRILCFEPQLLERPSAVVGEIFQSLLPFVYGETRVRSIAMPLVATGIQQFDTLDVMSDLFEAAVNWFLLDLPLETIRIVEINLRKAYELKGIFAMLKRQYAHQTQVAHARSGYRYDLFISYSHRNMIEATFIHNTLLKLQPDLRIFLDHQALNTGSAWQQELYEALDDCAQVLPVLTPHYLQSKVCIEEYNIALARHRDHQHTILVPFYVYSAPLPTYMQMIQFADCREFDRALIVDACARWAR